MLPTYPARRALAYCSAVGAEATATDLLRSVAATDTPAGTCLWRQGYRSASGPRDEAALRQQLVNHPQRSRQLQELILAATSIASASGRDFFTTTDLVDAVRRTGVSVPTVPDEPAGAELIARVPDDVVARFHLGVVNELDAQVVAWRYGLAGEPVSLSTAAARAGVSREAARQIMDRAERAIGVAHLRAHAI